MRQFTVQKDTLQSVTTETGDANGEFARKTKTARTTEVWLNVSAVSGTAPNLELIIETSLEENANFVEQDRIAAVGAAGNFSAVINRADDAMGLFVRVRWIITGTTPSFTFKVEMIRME